MKSISFFIALVLFLNATAQKFSEDSIYLSQRLEPFRKHLDSVSKDIDAARLLLLYQTRYVPKDTFKTFLKDPVQSFHWPHKSNVIPFPFAKYFGDQIIDNDSNNVPFIETEYNLFNKDYLSFLKSEYLKQKKHKEKINILLKYLESLNASYPSKEDWKFSRSNTFIKYKNRIWFHLGQMPVDTTKSDLLADCAETFETIDAVWWRSTIFYLYVESNTLLLKPFSKLYNEKKLTPSTDSAFSIQYLTKHNLTDRLIRNYYGMHQVLSPDLTININNELYPLERKKNRYHENVRWVLKVMSAADSTRKDQLTKIECDFLLKSCFFPDLKKIKFRTNFLYDLGDLIDGYLSHLLTSRIVEMTNQKKFYTYFTLGNILYSLHQDEHALKAYYKAYDIILTNNEILSPEVFEAYFWRVTSVYKRIIWDIDEISKLTTEAKRFCYLYTLAHNRDDYKNVEHEPAIHALTTVNLNRLLYFNNESNRAKDILIKTKKDLLADSIYSELNSYKLLAVYNELIENGWLFLENAESDQEERADSLVIAEYKNPESISPTFYENPLISEELSNFEKIEIDAGWAYDMFELNKEIKRKTDSVNALSTQISYLSKSIKILNDSLKKVDSALQSKSKENERLDSANKRLNAANEILVDSAAKLTDRINSQDERIKNQERAIASNKNTITILGIIAGLLVIAAVVSIISLWKLRKERKRLRLEISYLNQEISDLGEEKLKLTDEVSTLLSQKEANRIRYETELKYENEKVLREYGLKHEIVEVFVNLEGAFNAMVDISNMPPTQKKPLELYKAKLSKLTAFARNYYRALKDDYNTVDSEVQLSEEYTEMAKILRNVNDIVFTDERTIKPKEIVLPPHLINGLTKNAIEKGSIANRVLHIQVCDEMRNSEYVLIIKDDGKGIGQGFDIANLDEHSTGIKGIEAQLKYFNSRSEHLYTIELNNDSFINGASSENISGTIVILTFKPKAA